MSERSRLLVELLRNRRDLGELELFVGPGERAEVLARAMRLARSGEPGRPQHRPPHMKPAETPARSSAGEARVGRAIPAGSQLDSRLERLAREGSAGEILEIPDLASQRAVADACR